MNLKYRRNSRNFNFNFNFNYYFYMMYNENLDLMRVLNLKLKTLISIITTHIMLPRDWFYVSEKDSNGLIRMHDLLIENKDYVEKYLSMFDLCIIIKKNKIMICRNAMKESFNKPNN